LGEFVLDKYPFRNLDEARALAEIFREDYNEHHPHKSLGRKSPNQLLNDFFNGASPIEKHFVNFNPIFLTKIQHVTQLYISVNLDLIGNSLVNTG